MLSSGGRRFFLPSWHLFSFLLSWPIFTPTFSIQLGPKHTASSCIHSHAWVCFGSAKWSAGPARTPAISPEIELSPSPCPLQQSPPPPSNGTFYRLNKNLRWPFCKSSKSTAFLMQHSRFQTISPSEFSLRLCGLIRRTFHQWFPLYHYDVSLDWIIQRENFALKMRLLLHDAKVCATRGKHLSKCTIGQIVNRLRHSWRKIKRLVQSCRSF